MDQEEMQVEMRFDTLEPGDDRLSFGYLALTGLPEITGGMPSERSDATDIRDSRVGELFNGVCKAAHVKRWRAFVEGDAAVEKQLTRVREAFDRNYGCDCSYRAFSEWYFRETDYSVWLERAKTPFSVQFREWVDEKCSGEQ